MHYSCRPCGAPCVHLPIEPACHAYSFDCRSCRSHLHLMPVSCAGVHAGHPLQVEPGDGTLCTDWPGAAGGEGGQTAILIVEFANLEMQRDKGLMEVPPAIALLRLRPILMASLVSIPGCISLMISSGYGVLT